MSKLLPDYAYRTTGRGLRGLFECPTVKACFAGVGDVAVVGAFDHDGLTPIRPPVRGTWLAPYIEFMRIHGDAGLARSSVPDRPVVARIGEPLGVTLPSRRANGLRKPLLRRGEQARGPVGGSQENVGRDGGAVGGEEDGGRGVERHRHK